MIKTSVAAAAIVASALLVAPAGAQVDEAAKQILQDSANAIKDLSGVTYKARRFYTGGPLEGLINVTGDVKILKLSDKPAPAMWLSGSIGLKNQEPTEFTVASDGTNYTWLDKTNNTLFERPMHDRKARQQTENVSRQVLLDAFTDPQPYAGAFKAETLAHAGVEKIGDVLCNVIEAATADGARKTVYHIGVVDMLPRREAMVNAGNNMNVAQVLEIENLDANPQLAPDDLRIALPPGFVENRPAPPAPNVNNPPAAQQEPVPDIGLAGGAAAPAFTHTAVTGGERSLKDYSGNVVVLAFWGPVFSQSEACLNMLQELHGFFKGENIRFVAIACRENDPAATAAYVQERNYAFEVLTGGDRTAAAYKILGYPSVVVITKTGTIGETFLGCPTEDQLLGAVERATAK